MLRECQTPRTLISRPAGIDGTVPLIRHSYTRQLSRGYFSFWLRSCQGKKNEPALHHLRQGRVERSWDIDTEMDFKIVEMLMEKEPPL